MSTNQLVELATAMVDAFVQGGKVKPVLPEGRREDIVSTLAWLIANTWQGDDEALDAYIAALEAEQEKQGVREPLLAQSGLEIPDEQIAQIARDGFDGLCDDELAYFAFSSEALLEIDDCLAYSETIGEWLFDKMREVGAARRAQDIEEDLRVRELLG